MRKLITALAAILAVGISRGSELASSFKLVDQNPNSVRFAKTVSPRDYLWQVSAYYFGDAA